MLLFLFVLAFVHIGNSLVVIVFIPMTRKETYGELMQWRKIKSIELLERGIQRTCIVP
jgi:hypothetical protein